MLPTETYTQDDLELLLRACSKRCPTGLRNRALLALLWSSGLRIAEALALRPHDLDLDAGTVLVRRGKGGKPRESALFRLANPHVEAWIAAREKLPAGETAPLFCTLAGGPLDQSYVRHLVRRLGKKAGIRKRMHPHGFRHSHTAELLNADVKFILISRQLGHSRPSTTDVYCARFAANGLVENIREVA